MNQDFMNVNSWQEEDKNEDVEIDLVEIWQVIKKQFGTGWWGRGLSLIGLHLHKISSPGSLFPEILI